MIGTLIRNDEALDHFTEVLFLFTAVESPTRADQDVIERLAMEIESYEYRLYPIPKREGTPGGTTKIGSSTKRIDLKKIFGGNGR